MRYQLAFRFADCETEAAAMCAEWNRRATPYMRKKHPAHYTPWNCPEEPGKFIVWFHR